MRSAATNVLFLLLSMSLAPITYVIATHAQSAFISLDLPHLATETWGENGGAETAAKAPPLAKRNLDRNFLNRPQSTPTRASAPSSLN